MSLSDKFCVDRHKPHFLNLVKNKLDITFANEQEILSLINAKNFDEVISFGKNLKIVDLTGAGDLFAAGFLHGYINNFTLKESLQKGTDMSSQIIQRIGARLS